LKIPYHFDIKPVKLLKQGGTGQVFPFAMP